MSKISPVRIRKFNGESKENSFFNKNRETHNLQEVQNLVDNRNLSMNDNDPPPAYNDDDLPTYIDVVGLPTTSPSPQPSTSRNSRPHRSRPRSDTIITLSDIESHHSNRRSPRRPNVQILTHQLSIRSGPPPPISVRNEIFESLLGYMALLVFVFCCVILFRFIVALQEAKIAKAPGST